MSKVKGRKALQEQSSELIKSHICDPDSFPLPLELQEQFNRVTQADKLIDEYTNDSHIQNIMLAKYRVSRSQIRKDIALAKDLFKSNHSFDWDFWFAWQIKDQVELIKQAKLRGDLKQWNMAKKTLFLMIGEKPPVLDDPRRAEKNVFYIQVNHAGNTLNVDLNAIKNLPQDDRSVIMEALYETIDDDKAIDLMNS